MSETTKIVHGYVLDLSPTEIRISETLDYGSWETRIQIPPQGVDGIQIWDLVALRVTGIEVDEDRPQLLHIPPHRCSKRWVGVSSVSLHAPPQRPPELGMWFRISSQYNQRDRLLEMQKYFRGYQVARDEDITVESHTTNPGQACMYVQTRQYYVRFIPLTGKTDYQGDALIVAEEFLKKRVIIEEGEVSIARKIHDVAKRDAE